MTSCAPPTGVVRKTLFWFVVGLIFISAWAAHGSDVRPYYFGRTQDPTPVELTMQDRDRIIKFRIPKVYLTFSENWKGGLQTRIAIEAIFPSMKPVSASRTSNRGSDVVILNVQSYAYTGADYIIPRVIHSKMSVQWTLVDSFTDAANQRFRVYVNKEDVEKRATKEIMIKEFFVPEGDGTDIYFDCLRELGNSLVGCRGVINFGQNLSVEFQFKRSEFEKWREIRAAALSLLNSFVQKADQ